MCQFASWIEYKDVNYFLTTEDLQSKTYEEYKKYNLAYLDDIIGHGAIEYFYPELKGKGEHLECTDFGTPDNFPSDIVKAIKLGKLRGFGIDLDLLNTRGRKEYLKIEQSAYSEYLKIEQSAQEEYEKIKQSAYSEYQKIAQSALKKYEKIKQSAWKEYLEIEQPAYLEYEKIKQSAWKEYLKIEQPALENYEKIKQPAQEEYLEIKQSAREEYLKIQQSAFWDIFGEIGYRNEAWR